MAGFCRNCGSPLADAQVFCTKCGTSASGPPTRPAAQAAVPPAQAAAPPPPPPPQPRAQAAPPVAQAAAATPKKGMSTAVKVLLGFVIVLFVFGAVGIAGVWYLVHLGKQKVHDMGLDQVSTASGPVLGGADPCGLLSKEDVGQVVKMEVVRAERTRGNNSGCQYNVMGSYPDMVASHLTMMQKDLAQNQMTDAQKKQMDELAKSFFRSANAQEGNMSEHPGESPVFLFNVNNAAAKAQMSMTRLAFSRMGPAFTEFQGIGDEAFDIGGAMIMARKGDNAVVVMYMMCPCTKDDAQSLVRKIVANM